MNIFQERKIVLQKMDCDEKEIIREDIEKENV